MKKYLLFLLLASFLFSACTPQEESLQGTWTLTAHGQQGATTPVAAGSQAAMTFNEDGTVTGNSGCNGFGGEYVVDGDQVTFSSLVSTLMACEEPLMAQEGSVFQVLDGTASYQIDGDTLTITKDGMVLMLTSGQPASYPQ